MAYFWAERISHCECMMPAEIAWEVINALGSLEVAAFQTEAINYSNPFIKSYRRCDEAVNKIGMIRTFLKEMQKKNPDSNSYKITEAENYLEILKQFQRDIQNSKAQGYLYMNCIEQQIIHSHQYLVSQKKQIDALDKKLHQLTLELAMLITVREFGSELIIDAMPGSRQGQTILKKSNSSSSSSEVELPVWINKSFNRNEHSFQSKCICINRSDLHMLKRSVFRMTRGNSWIEEIQINPEEIIKTMFQVNEMINREICGFLAKKVICMLIYQRGQRNMLANKIGKFLSCIDCHLLKSNISKITDEIDALQNQIKQIEILQELTIQGVQRQTQKLCEPKHHSQISLIAYLQTYSKKQRQIYRGLSIATNSQSLMQFNIFLTTASLPLHIQPSEALPPLMLKIKDQNSRQKTAYPSKFDSNAALTIPQLIVNTYGVPSYDEINPAPFYIVTFGFFIGVMFGDVGHMLLAIPLLIYLKADKWFWSIVFFMGYSGLIYNEFFGLDIGLFTSCFSIEGLSVSKTHPNCVYTFGLDSVWKVSQNQMQFTNSLKMKMAVIIGVIHMMLGLFISLINKVRNKQFLQMLFVTIPQIVFLACTFLYMDFLIVFKWFKDYSGNVSQAPSIITTMIAIFVEFAHSKPKQLLFWESQRSLERVLLMLCLICVPLMLFGRPLIYFINKKKCFRRKLKNQNTEENQFVQEEIHPYPDIQDNNKFQSARSQKYSDQNFKSNYKPPPESSQHPKEDELKQIVVEGLIETIEFVLGTVSNTASYLRLWALSLAHAQLSQVIFDLIILKGLSNGFSSLHILIISFPFFLAVTFGVLICMDTMECFLHSLRLHWVEFQNKFYKGKGIAFQPFTFRKIILNQ